MSETIAKNRGSQEYREISQPHTSVNRPSEGHSSLDTEPSTEVGAQHGPPNTASDNQERLNQLLLEIGGFGRLQFLSYLVTWGGWVSVSFWLYALGYFIQKPVYKCVFAGSVPEADMDEICTAENICDGDPRISSW